MSQQIEKPTCDLCGEPMPPGEEMFKFHGYSGPCPAPFKPKEPIAIADEASRLSARWQELFWALPPGEMRSKLRALEIDTGRAIRGTPAPPEASHQALREWQPIETAPKDGTQVWAWDAERGSNPALWVEGAWWITYDDAMIRPTHWMPLPDPPAALSTGTET